jgi:Tfp pilus assembly protein PilV
LPRVLIILLVLAVIALAIAVALLWLRLRSATRREAMQALAARRGWSLTLTEGKLGRAALTRLAPRGGTGWQVTARHLAGATLGDGATESTRFETDEPVWADGIIVIVPKAAMNQPDTAPTLPDPGDDGAPLLQSYPGPDTLRLWATTDPTRRADWQDVAKVLVLSEFTADGSLSFPMVVLGPDGLRLHLARDIKRADRMEAFIDLGLELARIL